MKKLALAIIATAFVGFSHAPVSAQNSDPEPIRPIPEDQVLECAESEGRTDTNGDGISDNCVDFYIDPVHPTPPPGKVAATGSSGVSSMLGLGSALLVGGGIAVVSTRRRATASSSS